MNSFLTFLSNNYLYFLIAAGVLFFALLGFLVDLFKNKKEGSSLDNAIEETPIPDIASIEENQNLNLDNNINLNESKENSDVQNQEATVTIPTQESINGFSSEANSELVGDATTLNSTEVSNSPEVIDVNNVSTTNTLQTGQDQTIEEFK